LAAERPEQAFIGSGHPGLSANLEQRIEEVTPPLLVEMRNHLIQQQDRCAATLGCDQPRMREHKRDEQGLLLTRRGLVGGDALLRMHHFEIASMRPRRRRPCRRARGGEGGTELILNCQRRSFLEPAFDRAIQRQLRARKRP
jgi:hypothetical protein